MTRTKRVNCLCVFHPLVLGLLIDALPFLLLEVRGGFYYPEQLDPLLNLLSDFRVVNRELDSVQFKCDFMSGSVRFNSK